MTFRIFLSSTAFAALLSHAALAATPWPLGVFPPTTSYGGGYSTEATFAAQMGVPQAAIENFYVDFTQVPANWRGSSDYNLSGFDTPSTNGGPTGPTNPWSAASGVIPMGVVPMETTNSAGPNYDTVLQNYTAGDYDSMLQGMVGDWANAGYKTQYWRPGVEMNEYGSGSCNSDTTCTGYWRSAFAHIYTVMHAAAASDGVKLSIIWNPGADAGGSIDPTASNGYWPGAAYVDIIGLDLYGNAYPDNSSNPCPNYTTLNLTCDPAGGGTALGLLNALAFAKAQGKPVGFPETGAGGNGDGTSASGGLDNPLFPAWLAGILRATSTQIAFVSLWDSNGGCQCAFTPASSAGKPLEAAAWAANFGGSAPPLKPPVVTPPPVIHAASAAGTQLPPVPVPPIATIYDTSGNAWTITAGKQIARNGVVVPSSSGVVALYWTGTQLDQLNTYGKWWTQPLDGSAGVSIAAPAGYVAG